MKTTTQASNPKDMCSAPSTPGPHRNPIRAHPPTPAGDWLIFPPHTPRPPAPPPALLRPSLRENVPVPLRARTRPPTDPSPPGRGWPKAGRGAAWSTVKTTTRTSNPKGLSPSRSTPDPQRCLLEGDDRALHLEHGNLLFPHPRPSPATMLSLLGNATRAGEGRRLPKAPSPRPFGCPGMRLL
jgi:hypothetical protein